MYRNIEFLVGCGVGRKNPTNGSPKKCKTDGFLYDDVRFLQNKLYSNNGCIFEFYRKIKSFNFIEYRL